MLNALQMESVTAQRNKELTKKKNSKLGLIEWICEQISLLTFFGNL